MLILEKRKQFIITTAYFALILALIYIGLKHVLGLLTPFIIGFVVAFILQRGIHFVAQKLRVPKKPVAVVLVVLFYVIIGVLLTLLGIRLFAELKYLVERLPRIYTRDIEPVLYQIFEGAERLMSRYDLTLVNIIEDLYTSFSQSLGKVVSDLSGKAIGTITFTVSAVPRTLIFILLSIISSVFFAMDYSAIMGYLSGLIPEKKREIVWEMKDFAGGLLWKYVKAYALLLTITFTELALGLSLLKVEGAIAIAALIAIIDILPVLGTGLVVLPWALFSLIKGNYGMAIGLGILYLVITVIRNVLEPKVIGKQVGLHPLVILACMYAGVKMLGIIGLFVLPFAILIIKHLHTQGLIRFYD